VQRGNLQKHISTTVINVSERSFYDVLVHFPFLIPFCYRNALRKTERCNDCALGYGIAVISDLLVTDTVDNSKELLLLSARIASKVVLSDLRKDDRRRLVSLFHNIARQIEAEKYVNTNPLGAFFGINTAREARKRDENV
jgi:hypothetical protein